MPYKPDKAINHARGMRCHFASFSDMRYDYIFKFKQSVALHEGSELSFMLWGADTLPQSIMHSDRDPQTGPTF